MASPNSSFTEIVTTTLHRRSKQLADNVSTGNALLRRLNQRGNVRTAPGGRTIVEELEYAENSTFKYYSGYETLDITPSDVFSAAEYNWKQAAVVVSISGLEGDVQNAGPDAVINLLSSRIRNAERTMRNNLSTGIYSDGTGTSGKQIGGLQLLVANAPTTGIVGGINRATYSFWQNQYFDFSSASLGAASASVIQKGMRSLFIDCKRGPDMTNLITMDGNYYEIFWNSMVTIQRVTESDTGNAGYSDLSFRGVPVVLENDSGHPANTAYFLNTDYLFWRPHARRNMVPLEDRMSVNQDAMVVPMVWAGNLTMSNASLQGVMHN